uniref:Uncharacterized protein n=1 Tax=Oryza rufipogon TaxID=4529 RepID=A0A0E0QC81_ORYRU
MTCGAHVGPTLSQPPQDHPNEAFVVLAEKPMPTPCCGLTVLHTFTDMHALMHHTYSNFRRDAEPRFNQTTSASPKSETEWNKVIQNKRTTDNLLGGASNPKKHLIGWQFLRI